MEAEKDRLVGEDGGLSTARTDLENLRKEVESLNKEVEGVKAVEALTGEFTLKAIKTAENLYKEVNAERESSAALKAQVGLLSKCLEDAKEVGLTAAKLYAGTLEQFGGFTSLLPLEPSAFSIFSWMKVDFEKLPAFVGGTVDFGALATATNFAKMLAQDGC